MIGLLFHIEDMTNHGGILSNEHYTRRALCPFSVLSALALSDLESDRGLMYF